MTCLFAVDKAALLKAVESGNTQRVEELLEIAGTELEVRDKVSEAKH